MGETVLSQHYTAACLTKSVVCKLAVLVPRTRLKALNGFGTSHARGICTYELLELAVDISWLLQGK